MKKFGQFCKKLDMICRDLNVILVLFAIGLSVLDLTLFLSNNLVRVQRPNYSEVVDASDWSAAFTAQSQ